MTHQPSGHCWYYKKCGNAECKKRYNERAKLKQRERRRPDGTFNNPLVDPVETMAHLDFLQKNGVTMRALAAETGIHYVTLGRIRRGVSRDGTPLKTIWKLTADKVLACHLGMFEKSNRAVARSRTFPSALDQKSEVPSGV